MNLLEKNDSYYRTNSIPAHISPGNQLIYHNSSLSRCNSITNLIFQKKLLNKLKFNNNNEGHNNILIRWNICGVRSLHTKSWPENPPLTPPLLLVKVARGVFCTTPLRVHGVHLLVDLGHALLRRYWGGSCHCSYRPGSSQNRYQKASG